MECQVQITQKAVFQQDGENPWPDPQHLSNVWESVTVPLKDHERLALNKASL